ncbi:MAG: D-alanyl-D-alanine carboxypeptidase/D-alanyl-D-alanine-endopeptidase [Chitinophagia bacterium]|nr:D-alanyl-D-alanine carboxypeptidase/D-alanyl-D-alanine-endopeptidase [Chitinophagia bacterium]
MSPTISTMRLYLRLTFTVFFLGLLPTLSIGQGAELQARLDAAWGRLSADPLLFSASIGIYIVEAGTGRVVFDRNGRTGLLPASSQKVLTAAAAMDLLGTSYRYETEFLLSGKPSGGILSGPLVVRGGGDPTLGGSRFASHSPDRIAVMLREALGRAGVTSLKGGVAGLADAFLSPTIPDGWMWEDIGNYYGAGHGSLNWNENRYTLLLRPGAREGDPVGIVSTEPLMPGQPFDNGLVTGPKGSGDRAVLYFSPYSDTIVARGSVPCCGGVFRISGAVRDPVRFTVRQIGRILGAGDGAVVWQKLPAGMPSLTPLLTVRSPGLDSIVQDFLQKSVNLFGEALVRSLSRQAGGDGSYADGLNRLQAFWLSKGIDPRMLTLRDGSGLSPTNRVAAEALVRALLYARGRPWFPAFDRAMPLHDGIRMKSGTMGGVRSYAGYLKGYSGREYVLP